MRSTKACALLLALWGCGKAEPSTPSDAGAQPLEVTAIDAGCAIAVESWAPGAGVHVPVGTDLSWPSNPPCGGAHYPVWAAFQEFTSPVPRGYYVHDLEHGAVVLLYNCALVAGDCAPFLDALRQAAAALPDDPKCGGGVRVRTVLSPDPLLADPLAAASWGFVYRAQCVDLPSLKAFAAAHYAHAPEDECANGVTRF